MQQQDIGTSIEVRAAVALRSARTGLGWNQETAAEKAGVSKTTVARIETLVGQISIGNIYRLIETYGAHGVDISDLKLGHVQITFGTEAILHAGATLTNPERKRSDVGKRRKKKAEQPHSEAQDTASSA